VLTVLFGPIGLIKHGHDIDIKSGSQLKVFVADDTPLPVRQVRRLGKEFLVKPTKSRFSA
jgi:hypothetical protein